MFSGPSASRVYRVRNPDDFGRTLLNASRRQTTMLSRFAARVMPVYSHLARLSRTRRPTSEVGSRTDVNIRRLREPQCAIEGSTKELVRTRGAH